MRPYGLMADLHLHNWQTFASVDERGINTRLSGLLAEIKRCAGAVKKVGGDRMYLAGDIFHVRGSIAPTVLNPAKDAFLEVRDMGIRVFAIPGNHDLEGKHTERISSAVTALEDVGVTVCNGVEILDDIAMIPWQNTVADLRDRLTELATRFKGDVIIHAPVNGVIPGLPDHGLESAWVADLGFRRVFSGHYHNHKILEDGKVISIGASAHTTFSDVGAKAGFLIIAGEKVVHVPSAQPKFVDLDEATATPDAVKGNYVRFKAKPMTDKERKALRGELEDLGAQGVVIQEVREAKVSRDGEVKATVAAGASLEASVASFCLARSLPESVASKALAILNQARMETAE